MGTEEKYASEANYWRGEYQHLKDWFVNGTRDWWGLPVPREDQKVNVSPLWATNAIMTMHAIRPAYYEELQLDANTFAGQRILEVGCGPLIPSLQFVDCERHALDPLIETYMRAGWPLFDLDAKPMSTYGERMPYPSGYFDSAIAVNSLDHVDDFQRVASEMQRVVKPGGGIIFEIEYHKPTLEEPHELNDEMVLDAFSFTDLKKVREIGKRDLFFKTCERFGMSTAPFAAFDNTNRYNTFHGIRR